MDKRFCTECGMEMELGGVPVGSYCCTCGFSVKRLGWLCSGCRAIVWVESAEGTCSADIDHAIDAPGYERGAVEDMWKK